MKLDSIPSASRVFVDANIFIYHFVADPNYGAECSRLIQRIEDQDISAITTFTVLSEISHRLMTMEAHLVLKWPYAGIASRLRRDHVTIAKLTWPVTAFDYLRALPMDCLAGDPTQIALALQLTKHHGLLTNDALSLAAMETQQVVLIASTDADFDRIPGITRYSP
jgi:predicted nucleic acid-binding protein